MLFLGQPSNVPAPVESMPGTRQFIRRIAVATTATLILALLVIAEPIKQLKPSGYLNDFAGVIDQSSARALEQLCAEVDQKAHAQIAVVTIHSLDGSDIESYAVDLYKQWGIGPKSSNRGVLILLAVNDHRYRTEVGYGLEAILPDGKVGGFGREAVPYLKQQQYGAALLLMTQRVAQTIAADAGATLQGAQPLLSAPSNESGFPVWAIVLIVLVLVFIVGPLVIAARTASTWRGPRNRYRGGGFWFGGPGIGGWGSGGGFGSGWGGGGGFGSGSGFGGFGGGISGGGGASGSW